MNAHLARLGAITDPVLRFEAMARHSLDDLPHELEAALRAWGDDNPAARTAVRQMDESREASYRDAVAMFIDNPERCAMLARTIVDLLIGLQQQRPMDRDMYLKIGLEWTRRNVGLTIDVARCPNGKHAVRVVPTPAPVT